MEIKAELKYLIQRVKNVWHFVRSVYWVNYYGKPAEKLTVIGVTGTDGKTTTTTLIYEILKAAGFKVDYLTTVNSKGLHTTNPDASDLQPLLAKMVDRGITHVVLEVTAHGLDQHRVWGIPFYVGVLTNLSHEHLDDFVTMTRYRDAKLKLFMNAKYVVLNADEPVSQEVEKRIKLHEFSGEQCIIKYSKTTIKNVSPAIDGQYNKYNIGAAEAVANIFNIDQTIVKSVIGDFVGVAGRREEVKAGQKYRIVVDFAHTPNALKQILQALKSEKTHIAKLIVVFGATGGRDRSKRPMMGRVASELADSVIVTSDDTRMESQERIYDQIVSGIENSRLKKVIREDNRRKAIEMAIKMAKTGDVVLLAGKGHEKTILHGKTEFEWSDVQVAQDVVTSLN